MGYHKRPSQEQTPLPETKKISKRLYQPDPEDANAHQTKEKTTTSRALHLLMHQPQHPVRLGRTRKLEAPSLHITARCAVRRDVAHNAIRALDFLPDTADDTAVAQQGETTAAEHRVEFRHGRVRLLARQCRHCDTLLHAVVCTECLSPTRWRTADCQAAVAHVVPLVTQGQQVQSNTKVLRPHVRRRSGTLADADRRRPRWRSTGRGGSRSVQAVATAAGPALSIH